MVTYYEMILWYQSSDYIGLELSVTARLETITRCQNLTVDSNSSNAMFPRENVGTHAHNYGQVIRNLTDINVY